MDEQEQEQKRRDYNRLLQQNSQVVQQHPHTSTLVVSLHSPIFSYIPRGYHQHEYEDDLREIIIDQIAQNTFVSYDILITEKRKKIEKLRELCERLYIAQLQQYVGPGTEARDRWCETLAKLVYDGFYIEHLGMVQYVEQYVYPELARPFRFQYASIEHIDPVLAHMLIRVRCAVVATYGLDQAPRYYAPEMSRAYDMWLKQRADRLASEERIIAALHEEQAASTLSYGLLEDLIENVDMGYGE